MSHRMTPTTLTQILVMMTMKGENKETILSGNLNWKTKVLCPLVINLEQENYDLQRKPLDSHEELQVDLSIRNKDSPTKTGQ